MTISDTLLVDSISRNLIKVERTCPITLVMSGDWETHRGKDGKISVSYQGWDQSKVMLDG